jgi:cysteine-rich repeat protein
MFLKDFKFSEKRKVGFVLKTRVFQNSNYKKIRVEFLIAYATATDICGDGKKTSVDCDDGNFADNDGCSGTCTLESGYT